MARVRRMAHEVIRLRRILAAGYFPAELPPPFTTRLFANAAVPLSKKWQQADIEKFWTLPERYSHPRYGEARRNLSIVNPVNQLLVSKIIADNWDDISVRLQRSNVTEFRPKVTDIGGRSISGVDFDGVARRRAAILARYGRYVKTDISRFYASVYTHSVAWAINGKEWVKQNYNSTNFKRSFSSHLDKAIRAGQAGQSVGIPIGPDTSRVISELIATEIEQVLKEELPDLDARAVRYVDDMLIGIAVQETPAKVLSKLSAALYEYELELNAEKTAVQGLGCPHSPEWVNYIRSFELSQSQSRQREEIDSYFEQAMYLSDANPRENVLLFAAKRAASLQVDPINWLHLVRWFLYAARRSTTCLSYVVEHLCVSHRRGWVLPVDEIKEYIGELLPTFAEYGQVSEVAWLLFFARELSVSLAASSFEHVLSLRSSVCALLTLDLNRRGLISGRLRTAFWRSFATEKGLRSEMWLVAYEATHKGWWPKPKSAKFIRDHPFFNELHGAQIEFYDPRRRARPRANREFFTMIGRQWPAGGGEYP